MFDGIVCWVVDFFDFWNFKFDCFFIKEEIGGLWGENFYNNSNYINYFGFFYWYLVIEFVDFVILIECYCDECDRWFNDWDGFNKLEKFVGCGGVKYVGVL